MLKVVCTTDDSTANFTVTATPVSYTATPVVSYTSRGNLWTFKIPGGAPGPTGSTGPAGPSGAPGAKGDTGLQGIQGAKGDTGLQGIQGAKGDTGAAGADSAASVNSVVVNMKSSSYSASATYSSKTLTLNLPAGATGSTGATGSQGIQGPAGADGISPTISVNPTIGSGTAAVSVQKTNNDYKFTFTLPSIPTGYIEQNVCVSNNQITLTTKSTCTSGTHYTMLLNP